MSIRDATLALAVIAVGGCYTEQSIELAVQRSDRSIELAVKACRTDQVTAAIDEHCSPRGPTSGAIFAKTSSTRTSVHIVIDDDSEQVLLKMSDGTRTQCGVITVGDALLRYDVTVTQASLDWNCDTACAPSSGCEY